MAKNAYIGVNGVARKVKKGYIGVDGVARKVKSGFIGVNNVARQFFQGGTPVSDLDVGSSVYLNENGSPVEYIIVNKGIPQNSSLYDSSCDGIWLLRKYIYNLLQWHGSDVNDYENSNIHSYLNSTFISVLDEKASSAIKQVKIPYRPGSGWSTKVNSGANGLTAKIFLLSGTEVNWPANSINNNPNDGACLSYFYGCAATDSKRVAYQENSSYYHWYLRSPTMTTNAPSQYVLTVLTNGGWGNFKCSYSMGIRPALVLHSTALINDNGIIIGV